MKILADGTEVTSRSYYYLLEWNEFDDWTFMAKEFRKRKLSELNRVEYKRLFNKATTYDFQLI